MKEVRVGLVGYGMSGSVFHAPLITGVQGLTLAKVVSSNPAKVNAVYPQTEVVPHIDGLLSDPAIDLVVVTTPNPTHYPYARQALEAGKHVVVEKPFANSVQDADRLIDLAAEKNLKLSVFQNRRWDNDFLTVKKCVQEGLLGDIYTYQVHYDLFRPEISSKWKEHSGEGSGALYDLGSHLIDQALHLFGLPKTVYADLAKQRVGAEVDDYFHVVLGYDTLRVILQSGWVVKKPGPHFLVHGSKGSFLKYGFDPQQNDLQRGLRPGHPEWGRDKEAFYAELAVGNELNAVAKVETIPGSYQSFYQGLYTAIAQGGPLPVAATEARDGIRVIEAAQMSVREQRVVTLL